MKLQDAIDLAYQMIPNLEEHITDMLKFIHMGPTIRDLINDYPVDYIFTTLAGNRCYGPIHAETQLAEDIKRKSVEKYRPILEWYEKVNNANPHIFGKGFYNGKTKQQLIEALAEGKKLDFY